MKRIVFKLKKIIHKGDSVGRDISVSGMINNNSFSVSERRIQKHASREYDERLTQIDLNTEKAEINVDFRCTVSERDSRWNDIGESVEQINDEKYIHIGRASLGCLTITNYDKWNEIYSLLILARKGDGRNIGTLKVID